MHVRICSEPFTNCNHKNIFSNWDAEDAICDMYNEGLYNENWLMGEESGEHAYCLMECDCVIVNIC